MVSLGTKCASTWDLSLPPLWVQTLPSPLGITYCPQDPTSPNPRLITNERLKLEMLLCDVPGIGNS